MLKSSYELTARIYEHQLSQYGPNATTYLGLADAYAQSGHIKKAFGVYRQTFQNGFQFAPRKFEHLITCLVNIVLQDENLRPCSLDKQTKDIFLCASCNFIFCDPVTLKCGHTSCRKCMFSSNCKKCDKQLMDLHLVLSALKTNVLLSAIVERSFPLEVRTTRELDKGNATNQQHKKVCESFTKTISTGESSFINYILHIVI